VSPGAFGCLRVLSAVYRSARLERDGRAVPLEANRPRSGAIAPWNSQSGRFPRSSTLSPSPATAWTRMNLPLRPSKRFDPAFYVATDFIVSVSAETPRIGDGGILNICELDEHSDSVRFGGRTSANEMPARQIAVEPSDWEMMKKREPSRPRDCSFASSPHQRIATVIRRSQSLARPARRDRR
jgi:hypothetical protein